MPQEYQTTAGRSTAPPRGQVEETQKQAKQAAQNVRDQAGQAAETARAQFGAAADQARVATADVARRAKEEAQSFVARQKDAAATEISHISEAVRRAADKLHEEEDHNIASYAEAAASRAQGAAEYLKQHEVNDLLADIQTMAQRHPAAVCGGMFAAGVAIARFLKATPPAPTARRSQAGVESWQATQPPSLSAR